MGTLFALIRPVAALALGLCCITAAQAGPYTALYAFGDSLSDVGNDLILSGGAAPNSTLYTDGSNTGRFTNGLNYLDGLASSLGVTLAPSLAGGTDYAYGGARTNYVSPSLPSSALSFNQQIAAYDSTHISADPKALYVLWIGANDMADAISAYAAGNTSAIGTAIGTAMAGIGGAIGNLESLGAQHFLIPNLPDLALTPAINGFNNPGLDALAQGASEAFNQALASLLEQSIFSPLDIHSLDVYGALNNIVSNPAGHGLTNVTNACYTGEVDGSPLPPNTTTSVCADPSQYLFWDFEHPTAAVHAELATLAFAAVPEPPLWSLLLAGGGLITFVRRSRTRH